MYARLSNNTSASMSCRYQAGSFFARKGIQLKPVVNSPGDSYEQEADAMAEKVMQSDSQAAKPADFFKPSALSVQRKCTECEKEENEVQRKEVSGGSIPGASQTSSYMDSLNGKGRNLSVSERNFFEPKFGYDFSRVRVHTDTQANESAQSLNAQAYTQGSNIVFATNKYHPDSDPGKKLLAHELTHVVQQSGNGLQMIQRQSDDDKYKPTSDIGKELDKNDLFQELPEFARDKILKEIDKAPETITKAILDEIIDLAPIDQQYKEGLKKVGEAIITTFTGRKPASTSICDAIPGYHEGTSSTYKGMCCLGSIESEMACCPKDRFAPNNAFSNCCKPDEFVNAGGKCEKQTPVDPTTICIPPGKKDSLGKCCMPPLDVVDGLCVAPQKPPPQPKAQPFSLKFTIGVIDDYNINEFVINSKQKPRFETVKKQIHEFMEMCPASMVIITGFADKPGTEEHNMDLGQRRADHIKFLLQLDLLKVNFGGFPPLIFAFSEGENNPADTEAGEKYSARNRRVEIEFNSLCPPLGSSGIIKPGNTSLNFGTSLKLGEGFF